MATILSSAAKTTLSRPPVTTNNIWKWQSKPSNTWKAFGEPSSIIKGDNTLWYQRRFQWKTTTWLHWAVNGYWRHQTALNNKLSSIIKLSLLGNGWKVQACNSVSARISYSIFAPCKLVFQRNLCYFWDICYVFTSLLAQSMRTALWQIAKLLGKRLSGSTIDFRWWVFLYSAVPTWWNEGIPFNKALWTHAHAFNNSENFAWAGFAWSDGLFGNRFRWIYAVYVVWRG